MNTSPSLEGAQSREATAKGRCEFVRSAIVTDFRNSDCELSFDPNEECATMNVQAVTFAASPLSDPSEQETGVFLDRGPLLPFYEEDAPGDDVALTMELRSSHDFTGQEIMQFGGNGQLYVFVDEKLVVSQEAGPGLSSTTVDLKEERITPGIHDVAIFFARQGDVRPEFFATLPVKERECARRSPAN